MEFKVGDIVRFKQTGAVYKLTKYTLRGNMAEGAGILIFYDRTSWPREYTGYDGDMNVRIGDENPNLHFSLENAASVWDVLTEFQWYIEETLSEAARGE